jgi:hypothetical protein
MRTVIPRVTGGHYVPRNAGFITHSECIDEFDHLKERYGRKVPIKIEERARSKGGQPVVHVALGDGPNHDFRINEVDRNEVFCLLSSKAEGKYSSRNRRRITLMKLQIAFHTSYRVTESRPPRLNG